MSSKQPDVEMSEPENVTKRQNRQEKANRVLMKITQLRKNLEKKTAASSWEFSHSFSPDTPNLSNSSVEQGFKKLFYICERGDVAELNLFSHEDLEIGLQQRNSIGHTPLHIAILESNLKVTEYLIDYASARLMNEALMFAISHSKEASALILLNNDIVRHRLQKDHETDGKIPPSKGGKRQRRVNPFLNGTYTKITVSAERKRSLSTIEEDDNNVVSLMPVYITHLSLAAERELLPVVHELLVLGHRIETPHKFRCRCKRCQQQRLKDEASFAQGILHTYTALSSEAYLLLTEPDPIKASFVLASRLRKLSEKDVFFSTDYDALAMKTSKFALNILNNAVTNEETSVILDKGESLHEFGELERLKTAVASDEKEFVAHPNCQLKLMDSFYADEEHLQRCDSWIKLAGIVLAIAASYPFLAIAYICYPTGKIGSYICRPVIKFLSHFIFTLVFILLLVIQHAFVPLNAGYLKNSYPDYDKVQKVLDTIEALSALPNSQSYSSLIAKLQNFLVTPIRPAGGVTEPSVLIIMVFVIGILVQECKQVYQSGLKAYLGSWANVVDSLVVTLYVSSISTRKIVNNRRTFSIHELFTVTLDSMLKNRFNFNGSTDEEIERTFFQESYFLPADRRLWVEDDPIFIAEMLFATGNVLSIIRLTRFLQANDFIGPMLLSFFKLIADVVKFSLIFLLIAFAFFVGFYNLYSYLNPRLTLGRPPEPNRDPEAMLAFGTATSTFQTLFWAIFGMSDSRSPQVRHYLRYGDVPYTQYLGKPLFMIYSIIVTLIFLNMMIAMLTDSFDDSSKRATIEWHYNRTNLFLEYIEEGDVLPPPFNLLPTLFDIGKCFCDIFASCTRLVAKPKPTDPVYTSVALKNIYGMSLGLYELEQSQEDTTEKSVSSEILYFQKIMHNVLKRYVLKRRQDSSRLNENSSVARGGSSLLGQDFSSSDIKQRLDSLELGVKQLLKTQRVMCRHIGVSESNCPTGSNSPTIPTRPRSKSSLSLMKRIGHYFTEENIQEVNDE